MTETDGRSEPSASHPSDMTTRAGDEKQRRMQVLIKCVLCVCVVHATKEKWRPHSKRISPAYICTVYVVVCTCYSVV